jgi:hypothetical protein
VSQYTLAGPGLVGERVDGLDKPAGDILAAPRLGDVKIFRDSRLSRFRGARFTSSTRRF